MLPKILLLFLLGSPFVFSGEAERIIAVNRSVSIKVANLKSASVANGKIVRARAVPPNTLVVTGLARGTTTVRTWDSVGGESVYQVRVVSPELYEQSWEPGRVVKITLEFLELDSHFNQEMGIRWPELIQFSGNSVLQGDMNSSGLNYTVGFTSARGWIQHLMQNGWAKLLASPELFVRLGEESTFHSGGEFPVATSTETYGRFQRSIDWKPYGITVKVRPQSADFFHISSEVHVELSEIDIATAVEGIPGISKRNVDTKMNSRDGETVILSGLVRRSTSQGKEGLPVLSSLPLIGGLLFSTTKNTANSTEVFMAMTMSFTTAQEWKRVDEKKKHFQEWKGE